MTKQEEDPYEKYCREFVEKTLGDRLQDGDFGHVRVDKATTYLMTAKALHNLANSLGILEVYRYLGIYGQDHLLGFEHEMSFPECTFSELWSVQIYDPWEIAKFVRLYGKNYKMVER